VIFCALSVYTAVRLTRNNKNCGRTARQVFGFALRLYYAYFFEVVLVLLFQLRRDALSQLYLSVPLSLLTLAFTGVVAKVLNSNKMI